VRFEECGRVVLACAMIVSTPPGCRLLTRTPWSASSLAKAFASPVTPYLLAVYGIMKGIALRPPAELTRMMEPPPESMTCWAVAITVFQTPVRLTSIVFCQISEVTLSQRWMLPIPAFATTTSRRPRASTPAVAAASRDSRSLTSALNRDDAPALCLDERDRLVEVGGRGARVRRVLDRLAGVDGNDVGTLTCERDGVGTALSARRAGDVRDLARDPAGGCGAHARSGTGAVRRIRLALALRRPEGLRRDEPADPDRGDQRDALEDVRHPLRRTGELQAVGTGAEHEDREERAPRGESLQAELGRAKEDRGEGWQQVGRAVTRCSTGRLGHEDHASERAKDAAQHQGAGLERVHANTGVPRDVRVEADGVGIAAR